MVGPLMIAVSAIRGRGDIHSRSGKMPEDFGGDS
jgi:hypothetical protein